MDLTPHAAKLHLEPTYKRMVLEAARRLLKTRGVDAIVPKVEASADPTPEQ